VRRFEIESQVAIILSTGLLPDVPPIVPLALLQPGESGRIHDVCGSPEATARLAEMGLREGVFVRMIQTGTPCLVALGDQRLTFRGGDGDDIFVDLLP
jgi:ferrous iron transport protein A